MVADGKYHMVELLAIKKNFTLRVDRGLARSIINEGSKDYLKLSTPLFLGGLPIESGQQAYKNWHLRNLTSFKGCMKEVWINHKQVDFGNAARQQKVTPGCALLDSDSESNEQEEVDIMQETQHVLREEVCISNPMKWNLSSNNFNSMAIPFKFRLIRASSTNVAVAAFVLHTAAQRKAMHVVAKSAPRENIASKVRDLAFHRAILSLVHLI